MISTGKKGELMDINHGAVSGAIMTGSGYSNLKELVASMDLPLIPQSTYNTCHENIAKMWKTAAESSMKEAGKAEAEAAVLHGNVSDDNIPMIAVTADACWSKRSYKNNYSALSGVGAIIGQHTGKVLHVGVRNKYCVICIRATNKNMSPNSHNCTKNHTGSSTTMEQAILVEGFQASVSSHNLIYSTLIADGDASSYKNILESRPYPNVPIQKIECTNHLLRNYNGKNLHLQKDVSIPLCERKHLTVQRINRLRGAIRAAIRFRKAQNHTITAMIKNLQKDILNSPSHVFGDHMECENYYCSDENKDEINNVPAIKTLMLKLKQHASQLAFHARSLIHNFTNNSAEQFNSIVAKFVGGKRVNFSLKNSYTVRCYAAVVCFNSGKPQYSLYKSAFAKSPGKSLKRLETTRFLKNKLQTGGQRAFKRIKRKLTFPNSCIDYGAASQRPDMGEQEFEDAKKLFLSNLEKQVSERHEIERDTVLQAESALWLELRRFLLTASSFSKICKRRGNINSAPLVKSMLYSYTLDHITSIKHGKENEGRALAQLALQESIDIEECGLFIDSEHFFLGASPDALFEGGIIEIKCPSSAYGLDVETAIRQKKIKVWKAVSKDNLVLNTNHDWHYQIQGQLHIANKSVCLLAVWTGSNFPMKVENIYRDDDFWTQKMLPRLLKFYNTCILPEIVDPRKSRSMPLRDVTY